MFPAISNVATKPLLVILIFYLRDLGCVVRSLRMCTVSRLGDDAYYLILAKARWR
jgi:hypothetical protein